METRAPFQPVKPVEWSKVTFLRVLTTAAPALLRLPLYCTTTAAVQLSGIYRSTSELLLQFLHSYYYLYLLLLLLLLLYKLPTTLPAAAHTVGGINSGWSRVLACTNLNKQLNSLVRKLCVDIYIYPTCSLVRRRRILATFSEAVSLLDRSQAALPLCLDLGGASGCSRSEGPTPTGDRFGTQPKN